MREAPRSSNTRLEPQGSVSFEHRGTEGKRGRGKDRGHEGGVQYSDPPRCDFCQPNRKGARTRRTAESLQASLLSRQTDKGFWAGHFVPRHGAVADRVEHTGSHCGHFEPDAMPNEQPASPNEQEASPNEQAASPNKQVAAAGAQGGSCPTRASSNE